MKTIIKTSEYQKIGIGKFISAMNSIRNGIENHPDDFPEPVPSMPVFQSEIKKLSDLAAMSSSGDRNQIKLKNIQRAVVAQMAVKLSCYVLVESNGGKDVPKILRSGFKVAEPKARKFASQLPAPRLNSAGLPFAIALSWEPVPGAASYVVMTALGSDSPIDAPDAYHLSEVTTRTSIKIEGIQPGEMRSFFVYAVGASGKGIPSNHTTNMAHM